MTSFFCGLGGRIWPWPAARILSLSIAVVACLLLLAASGPQGETLILPSAERVLPLAPAAVSEAQSVAPPDEIRPQDQPPAVPDPTEPEPTASQAVPSAAPASDAEMDEVNQYLWTVYERSTIKRDGTGDFTWKDVAAAARLGMSLGDYVIGGMDRDFRELLYRAGLAMDAAGIRWTILSGFRDDYRQGLASGYKAHVGDSLHGGSFTTGGYGHGCAVDVVDADGKSRALWTWIDANAAQIGIERPLPGLDPAHVQPRGPWHEAGIALRADRLAKGESDVAAAAQPADLSTTAPSDADMLCIGLHHHPELPQTVTATPPEVGSFKAAARVHGLGKLLRGGEKAQSRVAGRLAARKEPAGESKSASRTESLTLNSAKPSLHGKTSARSLARPGPHAIARTAGTT
jgi:hypothetical protein